MKNVQRRSGFLLNPVVQLEKTAKPSGTKALLSARNLPSETQAENSCSEFHTTVSNQRAHPRGEATGVWEPRWAVSEEPRH